MTQATSARVVRRLYAVHVASHGMVTTDSQSNSAHARDTTTAQRSLASSASQRTNNRDASTCRRRWRRPPAPRSSAAAAARAHAQQRHAIRAALVAHASATSPPTSTTQHLSVRDRRHIVVTSGEIDTTTNSDATASAASAFLVSPIVINHRLWLIAPDVSTERLRKKQCKPRTRRTMSLLTVRKCRTNSFHSFVL
jgi:hypothetical protein